MNRGCFITLEGGEGSGKSTQISRLAARLKDAGLEVVTTREPGGSQGAEDIRKLLVEGEPERWSAMTEALLMYAARRDHMEKLIKPALDKGKWVISDRFADSTMAYQGYAGELGTHAIEALDKLVLDGFAPDLTLILDLPVEEGLARAGVRMEDHEAAEDRFEKKGIAFHEALRDGYLDIAEAHKERCAIIDASGSPDEVEQRIWDAISARLDLVQGVA